MSTDYCLVLCTCPDPNTARDLADTLVTQRHAACVNILPGLTSVYGWQGRVETAVEHLLVIKTQADRYDALESCIRQHHPYEVPEIVAIPIERGSRDYLNWIADWVGTPA